MNPLFKEKMISTRIMGGTHEEVWEEIEKEIYQILSEPNIMEPQYL